MYYLDTTKFDVYPSRRTLSRRDGATPQDDVSAGGQEGLGLIKQRVVRLSFPTTSRRARWGVGFAVVALLATGFAAANGAPEGTHSAPRAALSTTEVADVAATSSAREVASGWEVSRDLWGKPSVSDGRAGWGLTHRSRTQTPHHPRATKKETVKPSTTSRTTTSPSSTSSSSSTKPPSTTTAPPTATGPVTPTGGTGWKAAGVPGGTALKRVPEDVRSGTGWTADSSGNVFVKQADVTLSGLLIRGSVQNHYNGLKIVNSLVRCVGENDWCVTLGESSSITSTEIGGQLDGKTYGHAVAIWTGESSARNVIDKVLIHHQISGIRLDGGTTVTNSYIHGLPMGDPVMNFGTGKVNRDDHSGGIMGTRGANVVLRGNRIEGGNTANVFVQHDVTDSSAPAISNWLIEGNSFVNVAKNGQVSSWGVRIEDPGVKSPITLRNNSFTHGWEVSPFGVPSLTSLSGNVYDTGGAING